MQPPTASAEPLGRVGYSAIRGEDSKALDLGLWLASLAAFVALRLVALPSDVSVTYAFSHDSGYLAIVAQRVRDGLGFTNPAHWLLFLNPAKLPMPYHNANPGYPVLMAGISGLLGLEVARVGLAISVVAHGAAMLALSWLVREAGGCLRLGIISAIAAGLFPPIWSTSLQVLPDSLCLALCLACAAAALRARRAHAWAITGSLLGAAWLVRSTALLMAPALLWLLVACRSWGRVARLAVAFVAGAFAVALPWLVHTDAVWGSPFRSDASYYLMQDYHATHHGGDVERYWRSLTAPPSLSQILRTEPVEFLRHTLGSIGPFFYGALAGAAEWNKSAAALLLTILALAGSSVRSVILRRDFQAFLLVGLATVGPLVIRGRSSEVRYLVLAFALLTPSIVLAAWPFASGWRARGVGILGAGYFFLLAVPQDISAFQKARSPNPRLVQYRHMAQTLARDVGQARVVTNEPYFFTYFTGVSAISPPSGGKRDLLLTMERYQAPYLLLPAVRLDDYYPGGKAHLAPELLPLPERGAYALLVQR